MKALCMKVPSAEIIQVAPNQTVATAAAILGVKDTLGILHLRCRLKYSKDHGNRG